MQASDTHEAKFCATPDNSVNIERRQGQFQNNFRDVAVFGRKRRLPEWAEQRRASSSVGPADSFNWSGFGSLIAIRLLRLVTLTLRPWFTMRERNYR